MSCATVTIPGGGLPQGDALWGALRRGKLGPALHASLLRVDGRVPPPVWRRRFRSDYFASAMSHHVYRRATGDLLQALDRERLPAIVLRGTAVAERFYFDPALRPYTDIDLLVERRDLGRARRVARRLGYHPTPDALPERFYERNHLHLRYVAPSTGIPLEIHWALDHPFSLHRVDYRSLFRAAAPGRLGGAPFLRPSATDQLLILALHLSKHGAALQGAAGATRRARAVQRGLLLWMIDLAIVIRSLDPERDWSRLVRRAASWEVAGPVADALEAAREAVGAPVPPAALRRLRAAGEGGGRLERWVAALAAGEGTAGRRFRELSGRLSRSPALFGLERLSGVGAYLMPGCGWARRHAPARGLPLPVRRGLHGALAAGRLARLAWDLALLGGRCALRRRAAGRLPVVGASRSPARG